MKNFLCYIFYSLFSICICLGQIRVSSANVDQWIKANFSGQGVVVGNVVHHGNPLAIATFTNNNVLQLQKGLILSSGNPFSVAGFNNRYNQSSAFGTIEKKESDRDLARLISQNLYDIAFIEFDFVPMANSIQFNYQFGSDEYPEFVGSVYNDIFAFFVSDSLTSKNIALVPGKTAPVSINTINAKSDSAWFIDNNPFSQVLIKRQTAKANGNNAKRGLPARVWLAIKRFFTSVPDDFDRIVVLPDQNLVKKINPFLYRNLQYDGITKKLTAQTYVVPYRKYHMKIIIADVSDNIYDSGVFVEDHSLIAKRDTLQPGFVDYPNYQGIIDPQLILAGKKLEDLIPDSMKNTRPAATKITTSVSATRAFPAIVENEIVYFDFDKYDINPSEMAKLDEVSSTYQRVKDQYNLQVIGHTDSIGSLSYNITLSKMRNQAVIDYLEKLVPGISPLNITEKAYLQPAAENTSEDGRKRNRRVELIFIKK